MVFSKFIKNIKAKYFKNLAKNLLAGGSSSRGWQTGLSPWKSIIYYVYCIL
jgi:hypothetical protein